MTNFVIVAVTTPKPKRCKRGHLLIPCTVSVNKKGYPTCKECKNLTTRNRYMHYSSRYLAVESDKKGGNKCG